MGCMSLLETASSKSEEPGGSHGPVVVLGLDFSCVERQHHLGGVVDVPAIACANLEMLDKLDAEAEIPCHLAGLRLEGLGRLLVELERERRTGEHVGLDDGGHCGEVELILQVDGNLDEVLADFIADRIVYIADVDTGYVDARVHTGVHKRGVETYADDGHFELGHDAAREAAAVVGRDKFGAADGHLVDVEAGLDAETELRAGSAAAEQSHDDYCEKFLESIHSLICLIGSFLQMGLQMYEE